MTLSSLTEAFAFPVLLADIGGTNARFALLEDRQGELIHLPPVRTGDFADIESAMTAAVTEKTETRPRSAILALAGPLNGDEVDLTNADWVVRPRAVMAASGITDIALLNDFEAQALAVAALEETEMTSLAIGADLEAGHDHRVVLGPGTGLGVAGLLQLGGLWVPVPGEGGHVALGPETRAEFALWPHIERETERISAEFLLAGRGIVRLYRAMCAEHGARPVHVWPKEVTGAALAGTDAIAEETMRLYCGLLGRLAGDFALLFMARGGVFLGGGIAPKIAALLKAGTFRAAFEAKAPHEALMRTIATRLVTAPRPALTGLAAFARAPERFGVALERRRWRA
ncbi:glucokinase [Afifella pfennigii]|uniref:glucokinase n=1 Tax=Afifella pfennigii TaxID=209897 RepID=UPI00047E1CC4|nr:glucokinase [Afifella pfennigii]